jgi:hypothetical protein
VLVAAGVAGLVAPPPGVAGGATPGGARTASAIATTVADTPAFAGGAPGTANATAASVGASTPGAVTPAATGFGTNWPVYHQNLAGSGVDPANTDLSSVSPAWTSAILDGQIYGEPLVDGGRIVVATENNTVYALAANSGAILWHTHIATPVPASDISNAGDCGSIRPTVGITSTPVIDAGRNEVFVVGNEHAGANGASHHLVGLNLVTGVKVLDQPVDPAGTSPLAQLQRPGLTLDAGRVIIGFGGNNGDCGPYNGWLVAVPEGGGPMLSFEVANPMINPGDREGAIWMGGAAPEIDGAGDIWVATGNGATSPPFDDSDAVLKFSPSLQLLGFFAPSDWASNNASDLDLGSAAPALMAGGLVFQAGKSQNAYVISQSARGGILPQLATQPGYCGGDADGGSAVLGNVVYHPCANGVVASQVSATAITQLWQQSTGSSGGSPILAGGPTPTCATPPCFVWTISHENGNLYGLDPSSGNVVQGPFSLGPISTNFPSPTVADGLLLAAADNPGDNAQGVVHAFKGPAGLPPPPPPSGPGFRLRSGAANDVGVGANGSVWVVGVNAVPGGFGIWQWTGGGWAPVPGGAVAIAVDPRGNPWVVNSAHQIFHWTGPSWARLPGGANDVGVGANGTAWAVGTNPVPGGLGVWLWTGRGWAPVAGGAERIAVDPRGKPWVVNSFHQIFHWNGAGWSLLPGSATDVGLGASGAAWVIGTDPVGGGFGVFVWAGSGWAQVPGGAVRIAVDPRGNPWVVNSAHQIYSF